MKSATFPIFLFILFGCVYDSTAPSLDIDLSQAFYYQVNLNTDHQSFNVRLLVDNLTAANKVFQFAVSSPGTYEIEDIGRFVKSFHAYDRNYGELGVMYSSTNRWILSDPPQTKFIEYEITDTFHHGTKEHPVALSSGSSIESDNVLLDPTAVLGYLTGLQERGFYVDISLPSDWPVGTSLAKKNDHYYAPSYRRLADSPLFAGNLSAASLTVDSTEFVTFVHSRNGGFNASQLASNNESVFRDASKFLKGLPVKQYTSLYHFDDNFAGSATEHTYSAVFTFAETNSITAYLPWLKTDAAHEFFHIISPLTVRSDVIQNFNFGTPIASEHLWWYEGVTVWASVMMQYRNGSITVNDVFRQLTWHGNYYQQVSLSSVGLNCYLDGTDWSPVYNRGEMVAALLDIRLLELSKGTKGLREVILELYHTYHDHPFPEHSFNTILTEMTYPEIADFLERYVKGSEALPLNEYFLKLGINITGNSLIADVTPDQKNLFAKWSVNF